jgi:hypothetical protein
MLDVDHDDPFRTINYHHLDKSEQDGMDEQDIGWKMADGADEDYGMEIGQFRGLYFCSSPNY